MKTTPCQCIIFIDCVLCWHDACHYDYFESGGHILIEGVDCAMDANSAILKRIGTIKNIPTLPAVMYEVLATVASDNSSANDLGTIISKDQAICSRVLKMANSAFYAQSRDIFSIEEAIIVVGFDPIVQLTLATTALSAFNKKLMVGGFTMHDLWKHSIVTAVIGKMLAEGIGRKADSRLAYTAGLLHDIGKLVLAHYFPDDYLPVFETLESKDLHLYQAEQKVLGFTHCDIGKWLFRRWNFPGRLIKLIDCHHNDNWYGNGMGAEGRAMSMANILANRWGVGTGGNKKAYSVPPEYYAAFTLDKERLETIERKVRETEEEIEQFLKEIL